MAGIPPTYARLVASVGVVLLAACAMPRVTIRLADPSPTPGPTPSITVAPPTSIVTLPTPTPAGPPPTPTQALSPSFATARVRSLANVRDRPAVEGSRVVGQAHAGDLVSLLIRTPDGAWYGIDNHNGLVGWTTAELLSIDPTIAGFVPVGTPVAPPPGVTAGPTLPGAQGPAPLPAVAPLPAWAGMAPPPDRDAGSVPAPAAPGASTRLRKIGALCVDGTRTQVTGRTACAKHRGVKIWLYGK